MSRISHNQANQLRRYRLKRGLRLRDMARLTGQSSPAHLSHWEKGRKLPSLSNALRLSAATKCPVEVLFFDLFDQLRNETYENTKKHHIKYTFE
jgi:transcriptional regulator with XRE-family HTH domain